MLKRVLDFEEVERRRRVRTKIKWTRQVEELIRKKKKMLFTEEAQCCV